MTKEQLTGLGLLLMELRDWVREVEGESLDIAVLERAIDICGLQRQRLTLEGAP